MFLFKFLLNIWLLQSLVELFSKRFGVLKSKVALFEFTLSFELSGQVWLFVSFCIASESLKVKYN